MTIDRGDAAASVGTNADTLLASKVVVTPVGSLAATDGQSAFQELDADLTTEAAARAAADTTEATARAAADALLVVGPGTVTADDIVQFSGTTGLALKGGKAFDTDGTLLANSDTKVATQKAVKTYATMRGHIGGLTLSNSSGDATNDIDIAVGEATDSTNAAIMRLSSALTKQLDAAWAVGTNQGGLDTGAIANDVYHVFLIQRSDTGVVDALFSASATSPTMPTNYDRKRRIGAIIRSAGAIVTFSQNDDEFLRSVPVSDVNTNNPGTSAVTSTLSVPDGVKVNAIIAATLIDVSAAGNTQLLVTSPDQADTAPSGTVFSLYAIGTDATSKIANSIKVRPRTNTSAQIRYRISASDTDITVRITTHGWIDTRGRFS